MVIKYTHIRTEVIVAVGELHIHGGIMYANIDECPESTSDLGIGFRISTSTATNQSRDRDVCMSSSVSATTACHMV
jgi:hypothetical protein